MKPQLFYETELSSNPEANLGVPGLNHLGPYGHFSSDSKVSSRVRSAHS